MPRTGAILAMLVVVLVAGGCGDDEERAPADLVEDASPDGAVSEVAPKADPSSEAPVASEAEPSAGTVADAAAIDGTPTAFDETASVGDEDCPAGEHRHDAGDLCHPIDDGEQPATDGEASPVSTQEDTEQVICGEGMTLMAEHATADDNGCRPEECETGRGGRGHCLLDEEPLEETQAAEAEDNAVLDWEDYGLQDCVETGPGVCERDGVLFCHDTIDGWNECPGQPSGDPCEHDDSDPLSITGSIQVTGAIPEVVLAPGTYRIDVCLWGNNVTTGEPAPFAVFIADSSYAVQSDAVWETTGVVEGRWAAEITVPEDFNDAVAVAVHVTPEGGGTWVVRFSPQEG